MNTKSLYAKIQSWEIKGRPFGTRVESQYFWRFTGTAKQKEQGVFACYFIFPQLTSSQLVLFPNLHWCAEGLMFTFSKLRQRRKKSCFQVFTCRFSRFSYFPSLASWFFLAVVSHSALTHSTKMSDALNYPTYPPALGLKRATYCWKFWLAYIHLYFLSGNNTATFTPTKGSLPYSSRHVNMGFFLSCLLCSELAPERIFYLHVTCLLPGRRTEVSSYRCTLWSPVVPPWHPALTLAPLVSVSERC